MDDTEQLDITFAKRIDDDAMSGDNECDHSCADRLLIELLTRLGFNRTVAAWNDVGKWYA